MSLTISAVSPSGAARSSAYQRAVDQYGSNATSTASPARLLVMLYERLVADLTRGHQAQLDGDRDQAHRNLTHAQDVVAELLSSLRIDAWDGANALTGLYQWLITELVTANIRMDADRTRACLDVVQPLGDAWTQALTTMGGQQSHDVTVGLTG